MASPLDIQLILCDSAVSDPSGKVHMLGAGWSMTGAPTAPHAVVTLLGVPWDRTNQKIQVKLELCDDDGHIVTITAGNETTPVRHQGEFEVGRPPGIPPGSMLDAAFVVSIPALPLKAGRYQWRLEIGDQMVARSFTAREGTGQPPPIR